MYCKRNGTEIRFELFAIQWTKEVLNPLSRYEWIGHSVLIICILEATYNIWKQHIYVEVQNYSLLYNCLTSADHVISFSLP